MVLKTDLLICGLNLVITLVLNLFLEFTLRRSLSEVFNFINERTFVFLYNGLILFATLSLVLLFRKKAFAYAVIVGGWLMVGIANYVVLSDRKTPFTAVDLQMFHSILPVLRSYLSLWQILGGMILLIAGIVGLVCLFLYTPEQAKHFQFRTNFCVVVVIFAMLYLCTYVGVGKRQLIGRFDNLIDGYHDYGVTFGFCVTAIDTGIDRPIDYSMEKMHSLNKKINKKTAELKKKEKNKEKHSPNFVFIQLESFFDVTTVKGLQASQDPIPFIRKLREEYTSGYLKVPVYGAGTINTEFEVMTGMNLDYFGTGEFPYRSILHKRTCDNMSYWLKEADYATTVIHNNNASFYDRNKVFSNLGWDCFVTEENMDVAAMNEVGWAKDVILTDYIMSTIDYTKKKDLIYAISVQGHGDYPSSDQSGKDIQITASAGTDFTQKQLNQYTYYANETREMDSFIETLLGKLAQYPEETVVIAYGDHLPGMNLESDDLTSGSKYKTPYFIWDNYGYHKKHKDKLSGNVAAWQLASKVFGQAGIHQGTLNAYHQTMSESKNYKKNLKLLQYDMLYGDNFVRDGKADLKPSELQYAWKPVEIEYILPREDDIVIAGDRFTKASRVCVNGRPIKTTRLSSHLLRVSKGKIKDKDSVVIAQVSSTNDNIIFNESEPFEYHEESDNR